MEQFILIVLLASPAIIVGLITYRLLMGLGKLLPRKQAATPATFVTETAEVADPAYEPQPLVTRDIGEGKATLLVRYRSRHKKVTAHMIIWAGKRKKRLEDSYYDLGSFDATEVTLDIIAKATAEATNKLAELARPRSRKVAVEGMEAVVDLLATTDFASAEVPMPAAIEPAVQTKHSASAAVEVEENGEHQAAITLKKTPQVFRGIVIESGVMERALQDKIIKSFGVRYRTPEGVEDAVWGVDLKRAMASASVAVGDHVEILKIGRKTVEKGKAPMNLYQIAKIRAGQLAA